MGTSSGFVPLPRRLAPDTVVFRLALLLVATAIAGSTSATAQMWPERWGQGICMSQYGWCPLPSPERTPLGVQCYCVLPDNRYVAGTTSNYTYRGRVSPYFNLYPPPGPLVPSVIR
jgi:hypothetical protein